MKLPEIIKAIDAEVKVGQELIAEKEVKGGYISDLLSDVMGHAREGELWLTIQTHPNVVAVALLLNLPAVLFTAGQIPEPMTIEKAGEEGIVLLTTVMSTYEAAGRLYALLHQKNPMEILGFPADLHIHSALSPCAEREMDPPHIFRHAIELGIEVIAITDHNSTANLPAFMSDPPKGLWVIPGMELQTKEEVHLLCLFPTLAAAMDFGQTVDRHLPDLAGRLHQAFGEQIKVNRFGEKVGEEQKLLLVSTDFSLSEAFAQVAFFHGITYPAHADRPAFGILGQLGFIPSDLPVKTVEISAHLNCTAGRGLFPGFQLVQSSDAHRLAEMGRGCSMLRMARPCWEEFMAAVSGGNGRAIEI